MTSVEMARSLWRVLDAVEPQAISLTYWFRTSATVSPTDTAPAPVEVRVAGRRRPDDTQPEEYADVRRERCRDAVDEVYRLDVGLPPGGVVAWTIRVQDLTPGVWDLTASPVLPVGATTTRVVPRHDASVALSGRTVFTPLAKNVAPGVRVGAWPALVATGAAAGLGLQYTLARQAGLPAGLVTALSLLACLVGVVGAKSYYLMTHPRDRYRELTTGMSVQGFVLGVLITLGAAVPAWGLSLGAVLDVSIPGLLAGLAVGRLGCLLGGCCVGRPTASRWGLWSSDRALGVRRIPVQLLESSSAAILAVATLLIVLETGTRTGAMFVAGLSTYILVRQLLFPLRAIERATRHGRRITLWASAGVSVVATTLLALGVA
ncbi:prolipoprotein diacylglyceryl transferase [Kineosporia sp. R_H_3]|uniref:prolipoprotein diacylglyceryl transferase n=1 Tax=Kineosporia sp. R_H_3 TaxID=1961848 RepID=UPI0013046CC0|nr:prolipoprotein diacylglyceryl transferase family protein [Kineosporia sp. R_H_3]